jgi:hypothetical protein
MVSVFTAYLRNIYPANKEILLSNILYTRTSIENGAHGTEKLLLKSQVTEDFAR